MSGDSYHDGERAVQDRAGVADMAARIGRGIHSEIPSPASEFLAAQRFAVVGAARGDGSVWASIVTGRPGFLGAIDSSTLVVASHADPADPLAEIWNSPAEIGLLAIDFAARRRMRINGDARPAPDGFEVRTRQVYANCPKYIRPRVLVNDEPSDIGSTAALPSEVSSLSTDAQELIRHSDTFFVASALAGAGADASHRGGDPGFVTIVDERTLVWPDYAGNTMFQTLGNIEADGRAGLLFVDFATGDLLHVSGNARLIWDDPRIAATPGAERLIALSVAGVVERPNAIALRWR